MKPDTRSAMRQLIDQVRSTLPFDQSGIELCADDCSGCSSKLMEYLQSELEVWEQRLDQGVIPNFGDLNRLGRTSRKVVDILTRNGVPLE